jgi:hypothetical protein
MSDTKERIVYRGYEILPAPKPYEGFWNVSHGWDSMQQPPFVSVEAAKVWIDTQPEVEPCVICVA